MPDEDMDIVERPSRRVAPVPVEPQPKRYRVLKTIVVRDVKYHVGDVIDERSAHPKTNWRFLRDEHAIEEVK